MPKLFVSTIACLFLFILGDSASAALVEWHGTLETKLAAARRFDPDGSHRGLRGSGVATVNGSGGGGLINTLRIDGGILGSSFNPVTDPDTSGVISTIGAIGTPSGLGSGTLKNLTSPPLTGNVLTINGFSRLCLLESNCGIVLDLPWVVDASNRIGVGGLLTAGRFGDLRISIEAGPWTIGSGMGINQTQKGNFKNVTATGFAHGAGSGAASTANSSMIQLISPMQVTTINAGDNNELQSLFSILTLHFIPEPGFLLLLGAGVVGLGVLGRNRMRE